MWSSSTCNDKSNRGTRGTRRRSAVSAVSAVALFCAAPARAQTFERFTADSVIESDVFGGENVSNRPQVILDASVAVRLSDRWQIYARPWIRQPRPSAPGGTVPSADVEMYEAAVRYQRSGPIAMRVDAGYLSSPLGLGILDWRPSSNPTIVPHLAYAVPMVPFDPTVSVTAAVVANSYPLGAQLTLSTTRWDARGAVLNASPTRPYILGAATNPRQTPNVVVGGGITPTTGLRLGASFAFGAYATGGEVTKGGGDRNATIVGVEGEYAFAYTSLRGELMHTAFDLASDTADATEWFVQGTQILSPRWFAAARVEQASGPPVTQRGIPVQTDLNMVETTVGFRMSPEITLRGSYYTRRFYRATAWDHQVGVSIVWARRWW
jgi:hypothetical protein